ncbi:MAG: hypothetical protein ACRDPC_01335 [Solirubrobacteraceae bacterium]
MGKLRREQWPHLLLLCPNCAAGAAAGAGAGREPGLLPHRDVTFTVDDESPFAYELRRLRAVADDELMDVERVIVVGRSPAAVATIDYFALNTPFHDPQTDELRLLPDDDLGLVEFDDPRLEARTLVWRHADACAARIEAASAEQRPALLSTMAEVVSVWGCWSVWATVLRPRLDQPTLLALLRGRPEHFPSTDAAWHPQAGPEASP